MVSLSNHAVLLTSVGANKHSPAAAPAKGIAGLTQNPLHPLMVSLLQNAPCDEDALAGGRWFDKLTMSGARL